MTPRSAALVFPPMDSLFGGVDTTFTRLAPPSSLALLACEAEHRLGTALPIAVYSPEVVAESLLDAWASRDLLGLSVWFSNYETGMQIAREVKARNPGCVIVVGGTNATNLGVKVLENRQSVDAVVAGDGEDSLWRLIRGDDFESIPNLWHREPRSGQPAFTAVSAPRLDELALWDFRHLEGFDLEPYRNGGMERPEQHAPTIPPVPVSLTRGCLKSNGPLGRCTYCSIPVHGLRTLSPEKAWRQMLHLKERYGMSYLFETGDDFTMVRYLEALTHEKPPGASVRLRAYVSPWAISERTIAAFEALGVGEVFIGVETAADDLSKRSRHPSNLKIVYRALDRLARADISACLPFMFGLPGETRESAERTADLAVRLVRRYPNIRMVLLSLAMPLIGSPWFQELSNDPEVCEAYLEGEARLTKVDTFDYLELLRLSLAREAKVTTDQLLQVVCDLRRRLAKEVTVGCFGGIEELGSTRAPVEKASSLPGSDDRAHAARGSP